MSKREISEKKIFQRRKKREIRKREKTVSLCTVFHPKTKEVFQIDHNKKSKSIINGIRQDSDFTSSYAKLI